MSPGSIWYHRAQTVSMRHGGARFGGARADADTAKVLAIRRASCTVKTFATSTGRRDTRYVLATFGLESGQASTRRPPSPVTKDARPGMASH